MVAPYWMGWDQLQPFPVVAADRIEVAAVEEERDEEGKEKEISTAEIHHYTIV